MVSSVTCWVRVFLKISALPTLPVLLIGAETLRGETMPDTGRTGPPRQVGGLSPNSPIPVVVLSAWEAERCDLSTGPTCAGRSPRVTVRDRPSPGLMAR